MARTSGPLMSSDAGGTYKDALTFSIWKGRNYVRSCQRPSNPKTVGQQANRLLLSQAVSIWNSQYQSSRDAWSLAARDVVPPMSGYNYFIGQFILQGAAPTIPAIAPKRKFTLHGDLHMTIEEAPPAPPSPYLDVPASCRLYHAYWDGTPLDHSLAGNHGIVNGGASFVPLGLEFDGSNDTVSIATPTAELLAVPVAEIEVWLNLSAANYHGLLNLKAGHRIGMGLASPSNIIVWGQGTDSYYYATGLNLTLGSWCHIVFTFPAVFANNQPYCLLNDVPCLSSSATITGSWAVPDIYLIGGKGPYYDYSFNGIIGEWRHYSEIRSSPDRTASFEATRARYGV